LAKGEGQRGKRGEKRRRRGWEMRVEEGKWWEMGDG
jgi:hypothetical protein